jgi:hypothetical protein
MMIVCSAQPKITHTIAMQADHDDRGFDQTVGSDVASVNLKVLNAGNA